MVRSAMMTARNGVALLDYGTAAKSRHGATVPAHGHAVDQAGPTWR
jgi:hypothetical protein